MLQSELLAQLAPAIHGGRVVLRYTDDHWVALRRMFPVRTSGVRWEDIPSARSLPAEDPRVPLHEKADLVRGFLEEFGSAAGLGPDDRCVVFGDSATEVAFELSFRDLLDLFTLLFALPQATYVLTADGSWCFAFTFEEDMYFAKSPKA
jgi:hypothetical protein